MKSNKTMLYRCSLVIFLCIACISMQNVYAKMGNGVSNGMYLTGTIDQKNNASLVIDDMAYLFANDIIFVDENGRVSSIADFAVGDEVGYLLDEENNIIKLHKEVGDNSKKSANKKMSTSEVNESNSQIYEKNGVWKNH